ncbi:uncharacterized protein LOC126846524 [Adelges cooleyi]|uniref:uncharacterized protein LOC126846524 n=1 Tax=Adelges cooleyi TaxID=133065 RepID=UPI00217F4C90|nr:uncharacterized protein LOC126846524 [Adelges cooleyi]
MEKTTFVKFLVSIVLACVQNDNRVCADPTEAQRLFDHLQQAQHWDDMTWFDGINDTFVIADGNLATGAAAKLQMISPFLACAYGNKLHSFLSLTLVAICECDRMQRESSDHTDDCEKKLMESMETGRFVIFLLMGTLQYIDSAIDRDIADNVFYQILKPFQSFLAGDVPVIFSAGEPGGLVFYALFSRAAESLGNYLIHTCEPPNQLFYLKETADEFSIEEYPSGLYDFYAIKLSSYVDFIKGHLLRLGFHYHVNENRMVFDPSQRG